MYFHWFFQKYLSNSITKLSSLVIHVLSFCRIFIIFMNSCHHPMQLVLCNHLHSLHGCLPVIILPNQSISPEYIIQYIQRLFIPIIDEWWMLQCKLFIHVFFSSMLLSNYTFQSVTVFLWCFFLLYVWFGISASIIHASIIIRWMNIHVTAGIVVDLLHQNGQTNKSNSLDWQFLSSESLLLQLLLLLLLLLLLYVLLYTSIHNCCCCQ